MHTLTLKNTLKNLTLLTAGALMATMIAVPLSGVANANDDDDDDFVAPAQAAPTYTIKASNGLVSTFELVERDGEMLLVLIRDGPVYPAFEDDED